MKLKRADLACLAVIVAVGALAVALYADLPDAIPTRFNLATGEGAGLVPKLGGTLLLAALPVIPFLILKLLPIVSPRGFRMNAFQHVTDILMVTLTVCLGGSAAAALLEASGRHVAVTRIAPLLAGAALLVFGNYLGKVRRNFFLGVRTPWTLASPEAWRRTQRLSGRLLVIGGLLLVAAGITGVWPPVALLVITAATGAVTPIVYSLVLYRRFRELPGADGRG